MPTLNRLYDDEKIMAAATMVYTSLPDNTKEIMYTMPKPNRHFDIMHRYGDKIPAFLFEEGFVTNYGRFLDRRAAYELAHNKGQIIDYNSMPKELLFTENLW